MRKIFYLLLASLSIFTGCPSVTPPEQDALRIVEGDTIEHVPSGMKFPVSLEDFIRGDIQQYDTKGSNISVAYNLPSWMKPVAITVYVYPSPSVTNLGSPADVVALAKNTLAHQEFARSRDEILKSHLSAEITEEETISPPDWEKSANGYFAKFNYTENFAGQVRRVESLLYVYSYVGNQWTVKYRITYLPETEAASAVDWFMGNLAWTIR